MNKIKNPIPVFQSKIIRNEMMLPVFILKTRNRDREIYNYEKKVNEVIDEIDAEIVIVEKTEKDYFNCLSRVSNIVDKKNISCTNYPIDSDLVANFIYVEMLENDYFLEAVGFAEKVFESSFIRKLISGESYKESKKKHEETKRIFSKIISTGVDFLNISWKSEDPQALEIAFRFLRRKYDIPVISTQIMVPNTVSQVRKLMNKVHKLKIPCAIWYFETEGTMCRQIYRNNSLIKNAKEFKKFMNRRYLIKPNLLFEKIVDSLKLKRIYSNFANFLKPKTQVK